MRWLWFLPVLLLGTTLLLVLFGSRFANCTSDGGSCASVHSGLASGGSRDAGAGAENLSPLPVPGCERDEGIT